jgi:predicted NUDIX family NTP pyrophosphohydrolase
LYGKDVKEDTMPLQSAGILLYRVSAHTEVLLAHPGGPYWEKRDTGVWTIPKGLFENDEDPLSAARREFFEETGTRPPNGTYHALRPVRMKGGKTIYAWAVAGDLDEKTVHSNTFRMEYPYKSGRWGEYPEIDRAAWLGFDAAAEKIIPAQLPLLEELQALLQVL